MKFATKIVAAMLCFAFAGKAMAGRESGGGDICEDRIKVIRDSLADWIKKGGHQRLSLPNAMTADQYASSMLEQINKAKIRCVSPGDQGYPVEIGGTAKQCRFDRDDTPGKKINRITCDYQKFTSLLETEQYALVHHEFAGLAQIESPAGDSSNYDVSNQVALYFGGREGSRLGVRQPESFDFTIGQSSTILIASTRSSCAGVNSGTLDTNISSNYFQLGQLNVIWNSKMPLTIQFVRFKIHEPGVNSGSEYICTMAGTDLLNTWIYEWDLANDAISGRTCKSPAPQSVIITKDTAPGVGACNQAGKTNSCPFSCGGITMTNPAKSSEGFVEVMVYASYSDGNGNTIPLTVKKDLLYEYTGFAQ